MMDGAWLAVSEGLALPFAQRALVAAVLAGLLAGPVGVLLLVRRQAMLGDTTSHATLPGLVLVLALFHGIHPWALLAGAASSGVAGAAWAAWIGRGSRARTETGLAVAMTTFYGAGTLLWSLLQGRMPFEASSLRGVLLGNPAGLTAADVVALAVTSAAVLALLLAGWRTLTLHAFDAPWAASANGGGRWLGPATTWVLALAVVVLGRSMGVLLVTGLLVLPAQSALLHARTLGGAARGAAAIGVLCAVAGDLLSLAVPRLPTAPAIVLTSGIVFVLALALDAARRRAARAEAA